MVIRPKNAFTLVELLVVIAIILPLIFFVGGCSQPKVVEKPIDPTQQQLILIGNAYRQYTYTNERPPTKPDDLKPQLTEQGASDSVWVSARDGQPFVIVWNLDVRQPTTGQSTPVLIYEKTGKNGKRMVRTVVGSVEELSEQEFAALSFPPGHTPEKANDQGKK